MLFFNSAAEIFTVNDAEAGTAIPRNMDCPNIIDRRNRTFTARDELWLVWIVHPDELKAYMHFITAICEMSTNQKRINATEKEIDNEKYAFRCFLLRLGFIGDEYKAERKILLRNLSGSSAFKGGSSKEVTACEK